MMIRVFRRLTTWDRRAMFVLVAMVALRVVAGESHRAHAEHRQQQLHIKP